MVEMDTNHRMSDLPHDDLENLAQRILVGSERYLKFDRHFRTTLGFLALQRAI